MKRLTTIYTACFLLCGSTAAQTTNQQAITFEQAWQKTIEQNHLLTAKSYEYQSADKERKATAGLRSPQIGLIANYSFLSKEIGVDANKFKPVAKMGLDMLKPGMTSLPPIAALFNSSWKYTLQEDNFGVIGATVKMPIYMGGKINAAYSASKIKLKEIDEQREETKGILFTELTERYFGLSLANSVIKVRDEVRDGMQHHYNDAVELEKNGIIAKGEKLYAQMHLSKAVTEYDKSKRDAQTINYALNNTMNDSLNNTPSTPLFVLRKLNDIGYYKELATTGNSKLKQVRLKSELAKAGVKAARADFIPHITAMGTVNIYDHQLADILPRAVAGVNLSFNIFNGLNREFKYSASKLKVKQVETLEQKGVEDISMLVEKLYCEIVSLGEQYFSSASTLDFANEYLRIKDRAFTEGVATSTDVVDARLNLAKTEIERLQIAYQYDLLLAKLLEVCGIYPQYLQLMNSPEAVIIK